MKLEACQHNIEDRNIGPDAWQRHIGHLHRIYHVLCRGPHNASSNTLCLLDNLCHSCIRYLGRCERRKQSRKSCTFSHEEETFSRDSACFLKLRVYDQKYNYNVIIQAICTWSRTKYYWLYSSTNGENASTNIKIWLNIIKLYIYVWHYNIYNKIHICTVIFNLTISINKLVLSEIVKIIKYSKM